MATQMLRSTRERVLSFIKSYQRRNGYAPSMREIGDGVGVSSLSTVSYQLECLEDEGRITRDRAIPRSIVVVSEVESGEG